MSASDAQKGRRPKNSDENKRKACKSFWEQRSSRGLINLTCVRTSRAGEANVRDHVVTDVRTCAYEGKKPSRLWVEREERER